MKKARNIIVLLMLLGAASLAEAQIVISQTTVSTTRVYEKSGREKGFLIRPEAAAGVGFGVGMMYDLNCSFGYQFNPYFSIGGGTGINSIGPLAIFPFYVNARAYFCDRLWSPFFDVKVGLTTVEGFRLNGTLGMQYKNFDFGCTVGMFNLPHNGYAFQKKLFLMGYIAYNFQFSKN